VERALGRGQVPASAACLGAAKQAYLRTSRAAALRHWQLRSARVYRRLTALAARALHNLPEV